MLQISFNFQYFSRFLTKAAILTRIIPGHAPFVGYTRSLAGVQELQDKNISSVQMPYSGDWLTHNALTQSIPAMTKNTHVVVTYAFKLYMV